MNEELTYSYAATISERIQCWKNINNETNNLLNQWQARKSLLKSADYEKMFRSYHLEPKAFSRALLPFTEERAHLLLPMIKTSEWFRLHNSLFLNEIPIKEQGLKAALRFHLHYYETHILNLLKKFPLIQLPKKGIDELVEQLSEEFFFIAQKTLVWDVHQMIEEYQLQAETKEEEFAKYIEEFLGDKQRTYLFYGEYPTLARVLAVRLIFACEMIEAFFHSINDSAEQLMEKFDLVIPINITQIKLGQGDSHDRGKTVIQFQAEKKALIFKFKNLAIGERFNELLAYVEELNPSLSFYKIKRMIQPAFTVEEKVMYQECMDETDVSTFYRRYGQLLAIVYWLGGTDLHMENLIASGAHPVLIDVETLIRPEMFHFTKKLSRQTRIEKQSVIVSGLLPQKKQWKRELEMDALSGTKQKLPKKVRRLRNDHSSDIAFQLEEAYMDGAQNIPRLAGEEVDYQFYRQTIQTAFKDMNQLLLKNKSAFIEKVKELFTDTTIRLIYRDTQDYGNLLNFTLHPECMSNYIEREKIIENLWGNQIIPEKLIPFEVESMLTHDIPLVTANASSTTVCINGHKLPHLLQNTPLEDTIAHMEQITETTSNFSYLLLKESLGTLEYSTQEITIPSKNETVGSDILQKAADIGDMIIDQIAVNQAVGEVNWMSVMPEGDEDVAIIYPETDLYGGNAGVYLFLVYLNQLVPKEKYQEVILLLEKEIFYAKEEKNIYESAFFGEGMRLTTAYYVTRRLKDEQHHSYLQESLRELGSAPISENNQQEWLYGKASLLAILADVYQKYQKQEAYDLLWQYAQRIECQKMEDNSFAHGYAGVLYGLIQANQVLKDKTIEEKITWYQKRFEELLETKELPNASWCRGTTGIEEVCRLIAEKSPKDKSRTTYKAEKEDCLCHGYYGNVDNYLGDNFILVKKTLFLKSDPDCLPISLFNGLSGIGYQLLRAYDPTDIQSLLFFK
ncbi:type 2 lanthipeptide synthetase LanM [Candidatus Enterococcus mansonii]|uniref:Lantibiotic biosynthesis protein dehydration domain-containing protein n=1 Tax=Candidatus Enterococcus mansonii TaxID=1834181 RepID=A0A242CGT0_9ENTE|nr:type 2 lanthipeptide synthetase LanM [Enterococcus sp. 4G2_DIV0659]OTO09454.1 hypothetical protein A5880_000133 [Enterococcus sp. 4G2_DIV0659]